MFDHVPFRAEMILELMMLTFRCHVNLYIEVCFCPQTVLDDLERRTNAIVAAKDAVKEALTQVNPDNAEECE